MSSPRITRMDTKTGSTEGLTNRAGKHSTLGTSLPYVSTAGREAGPLHRLLHFSTRTMTTENAERPFSPQSGQESPTLGANPPIPKKKRPAFAGRRSGDAIPGGVRWIKYTLGKPECNHKATIALTADAFQNRFDTALLISGDSDLTGPVLQVKQFFPAKRVVVVFPPARSSARLLQEAHAAFTISRKTLQDSQLPDPVTKSDGFVLNRPPEWK